MRPRACRSAISAPAPAPRRRWSPRAAERAIARDRVARRPARPCRSRSQGPRADAADRRRRGYRAFSSSTARRSRSCAARSTSRSCPARRTCSRSRARSSGHRPRRDWFAHLGKGDDRHDGFPDRTDAGRRLAEQLRLQGTEAGRAGPAARRRAGRLRGRPRARRAARRGAGAQDRRALAARARAWRRRRRRQPGDVYRRGSGPKLPIPESYVRRGDRAPDRGNRAAPQLVYCGSREPPDSKGRRRSLSTTASRPVRRCASRCTPPAGPTDRLVLAVPVAAAGHDRAACARRPTRSSASRCPRVSGRSASSMPIFGR